MENCARWVFRLPIWLKGSLKTPRRVKMIAPYFTDVYNVITVVALALAIVVA
ncbi:hypothetical protein [Kingella sp. (in: b-proteobacteria)]|uniref:hypothetical protein n=1 Tax=Kingella sp. (in: b-proteobacteria) TaxID=2020713 RepID=UPI0026DD6637|nr:hypothetical protein [Kingella sp. (in: b-proteobacteria)]MDO4658472.1 hypothetical protein [Kingella sp. (in: b-proteobacteria)]